MLEANAHTPGPVNVLEANAHTPVSVRLRKGLNEQPPAPHLSHESPAFGAVCLA